MWNKFKQLKYPILVVYFVAGIIPSVLIYQFIATSIRNQALQFNALFVRDTVGLLIACLIGALFGGFIYLIFTVNDKGSEVKDREYWLRIKNVATSALIQRNVLTFSMGGFTGMLIKKILEMNIYDNFIRTLFSYDNIGSYAGIISAASVFAVIITLGIVKRLSLLYGN